MKRFGIRSLATLLTVITVLCIPLSAHAYDELKNTDPEKYYILLDLKNEIVTVFEKDANGEYTRIVRRFLCSTGRTEVDENDPEDEGTPTPVGIWKIGGRERFGKFANFGNEYARYWVQIVGDIYFHSLLFSKRDVNTMKSSPFGKMGSKVSHGCVRLYVEDAKWLYYYACPGTTVNITNGEPSRKTIKKALKSTLSFKQYAALQAGFYDNDPLPDPTATVIVDGARMRKEGASDASTIKKLPAGAEVDILLEGDAWVKVRYDKREGYVRRGHITLTGDGTDVREDAHLIRSTVWMLETPESNGQRICKVPFDTSVQVLSVTEDGKWTEITYWNERGFIPSNKLKTGWGKNVG